MTGQGSRWTWVLGVLIVLMLAGTPGASATFPGDNGLIVVQASTADGVQLFTLRPDGTDMRQITHVAPRASADNPGASHPDWSPDGRTITFDENDCQMALIDPDGSDLREVPAEPGHHVGIDFCEGGQSFTPDGKSLVYERFDGTTDGTWIVNLDGTGRRRITDFCPIAAVVSPDGTRLACRGGPDNALWVMNMDGTGALRVSPPAEVGFKHDWAPDGSVVLFSQHPSSDSDADIATVAPDGTGLRWLTDYGPDTGARAGSYSPDGASIIFQLTQGDRHALARMAADGSDVVQLTEYSATWPGLDGVGFNDPHFPYFDWGPTPARPVASPA
jgi:Tol biopolymer transport system component